MEHGCHQVQECEAPRPAFLFIQEELTERRHAAVQIHTHPDGRHGLTHSHTPQSDSAQTAVHQGQDERIDSCTRFRTSASSRKYLKTYCLPRSFYSSKIKLKTKTRCHEVITLWFKTIKKLFNIITTEEETTALTLNHRRLLDVFINELTRQEQRYRHRRLSRRHCW